MGLSITREGIDLTETKLKTFVCFIVWFVLFTFAETVLNYKKCPKHFVWSMCFVYIWWPSGIYMGIKLITLFTHCMIFTGEMNENIKYKENTKHMFNILN